MGLTKTAIGIGAISLALLVLFITFRKVGIPLASDISQGLGQAGENLTGFFGDAGKGITDFFDSLDVVGNVQDGIDQASKDTQQALEDFQNDAEKNLDNTSNQFNDFLDNAGKKIEDFFNNGGFIPNAFGDTVDSQDTVILKGNEEIFTPEGEILDKNRPLTIEDLAKKGKTKKTPKTGNTIISGNVRNELQTQQTFQSFSADSSRPVKGVIRKTKRDPRKLKIDSRKNPLETASERANRVFLETGDFADSKRGATSFSKSKNSNFDFGTNTGNALKRPTNSKNSKLRRKDRLKLEAERASKIFDSRGISNF